MLPSLAAARAAQDNAGGGDLEFVRAMVDPGGELHRAARARSIKRPRGDGVDGALDACTVLCIATFRRDMHYGRDVGKGDAARVVAGVGVIGNDDAALVTAIDELPFFVRMHPLALLRPERSCGKQSKDCQKRENIAVNSHANIIAAVAARLA